MRNYLHRLYYKVILTYIFECVQQASAFTNLMAKALRQHLHQKCAHMFELFSTEVSFCKLYLIVTYCFRNVFVSYFIETQFCSICCI